MCGELPCAPGTRVRVVLRADALTLSEVLLVPRYVWDRVGTVLATDEHGCSVRFGAGELWDGGDHDVIVILPPSVLDGVDTEDAKDAKHE